MIRHVVVFKLRPGVSEAQREERLEMSRRVHEQIDLVRAYSIGEDLLHLPRSYDVRAYADDPAHLSTVELSRSLSEHTASVDFEL